MNTPKKPNIGVIGLGLIGGSIAKAAIRARYGVIGIDKDKSILNDVVVKNSIGWGDTIETVARNADIIFIAVPGSAFVSVLNELAPHLRPGQIVSDVSSTKQSPTAALATVNTGAIVVGGHPMAGAADSGWEASKHDLFHGCVWVLCPPTPGGTVPMELIRFLTDLGIGRTLICSPEAHDRAVAAISHGVQVSATSLAAAVMDVVADEDLPWVLAAGGFRDSTRIAESNPRIWVPILLENGEPVQEIIRAEIARLQRFNEAISDKNAEAIGALLEDGRKAREMWAKKREETL